MPIWSGRVVGCLTWAVLATSGVAQASPVPASVTSIVQDPGPPPTLPPERSPTMPPEPGAPVDPPPAAKPPVAEKPAPTPVKPTPKPQPTKPTATAPTRPAPAPAPARPGPPPTTSKAPPSDNLPPPPEPLADVPEPLDEPAPDPADKPQEKPKQKAAKQEAPTSAAEGPEDDRAQESKEDQDAEPKDKRAKSKKFRHRGLILEFKIGAAGCFKSICKSQGYHYAKPGLSLGGFAGGNIFGFLDFGLEVMWAAMTPRAYSGRNVVDLYGIDSLRLQQLLEENAEFIGSDFRVDSLVLGTAKTRVLNVGPAVRIHVIPRGRVSAYVGTALDYQRWRNKYVTIGGPLTLDFHGLALPILGGVGFYPHPNIAVGFEFRWVYSAHLIVVAKHPELHTGAPVSLIDMAGRDEGIEVSSGLPTFWHANASLRARF